MIRPIHRDFRDVLTGDACDEVVDRYLIPNEYFFRPYLAFQTAGEMGWDAFTEAFRDLWCDREASTPVPRLSEAAERVLEATEQNPVDALASQGYHRAVGLLGPRAEIDLYVCVGLELSNAFMVVVGDKPAVGVALEVYGRRFGTAFVGFEDLLHVIPHEMCHAVRAGEPHSPFVRFFRDEDPKNAMQRVTLHEMLVEEGLACWTGSVATPEVRLSQTLFYSPEDFRWCEQNVDQLWEESLAHGHLPLGNEGFTRWFGIGPENGDLPPRAGYYLGYRLVERYLRENPGANLASAARQPAEAFLP